MSAAPPSVALFFGNNAWDAAEFDFSRDERVRRLLALPSDRYREVLLHPWGNGSAGDDLPGTQHDIELFTRFVDAGRFRALLSFQDTCDAIRSTGRTPILMLGGFGEENSARWLKWMRERKLDGELYRRVFQWFVRPDGTPRCKIAWDRSGGNATITDLAVQVIARAEAAGIPCLTEALPYAATPLHAFPSITTMWGRLSTPDSLWNRPAPGASMVLLSDNSGIGDTRGRYDRARDITHSPIGYDYRLNYVPETIERGNPVIVPLDTAERICGGDPPAFWTATGRESIGGDA